MFTFVTPPTPPTSPNGGTVNIGVGNSLGCCSGNSYQYSPLSNYVPVTPFRILDTRTAAGGGPIGPGQSRFLEISGPVSPYATAVVMNVTEVSGTASSLLTVYPFGTSRPNASNLNFAAHTVIANLVTVVTLGPGGKVNIYNALGSVNVLVDVEGYFAPPQAADRLPGLFHPIGPCASATRGAQGSDARLQGTRRARPAGVTVKLNVTCRERGCHPHRWHRRGGGPEPHRRCRQRHHIPERLPDRRERRRARTTLSPTPSRPSTPAGAVQANRVIVELGPATTGGA